MLRFTISKAFALRHFRYKFSQALKHPIMDSKSLLIGPRSNAPQRQISKLFSTTRSHIEKLEHLLQTKQRELLNKFKIEELVSELGKASQQNPDITQFLEIYRNLVEAIQKSQINSKQVYNIIGWYNMVSLKKKLIEKLLGANEEEIPLIIESLSWMQTPQQNVESMFESREVMIEWLRMFFRKIPFTLSIDHLKKIDETINKQLHYLQRKYFERYLAHHLDNFLRNTDSKEESKLMEEVIWLLQKSVKAMNDNEVIISKIQKFIQMKEGKLSNDIIEKLINVYRLTGRMNVKIYREHVKPYIQSNKMKKIGDLVKNIEFIICSQIEDYRLLNQCFDKITASHQLEQLTQQEIKKLHFYTHYLKTKKQTIDLPLDLQIKMKSTCKSCSIQDSISGMIIKDKSVKPKLSKIKINFISQCLYQKQTNMTCLSQKQKNKFIDLYGFKLIGYNFKQIDIYKKSKFCGIQLDYCMHQRNKNQFINVQSDCETFTFTSGRFNREVEIKNQILTFYGIKVIHLNHQKFISRGKLGEEEQMMFSKAGGRKKR